MLMPYWPRPRGNLPEDQMLQAPSLPKNEEEMDRGPRACCYMESQGLLSILRGEALELFYEAASVLRA
ncbi:unnamed protein product [Allacma fusca]|uniref:Uncharacterized protein n=1 Tax=Allacma fusca TaxID=39272 RepID=A0A8J2LAF8_9HEXA|nr:unnamed protein product [Allacma fusca]